MLSLELILLILIFLVSFGIIALAVVHLCMRYRKPRSGKP